MKKTKPDSIPSEDLGTGSRSSLETKASSKLKSIPHVLSIFENTGSKFLKHI